MATMLIITLLFFSACLLPAQLSFTVPRPKFEAIYPRGFRVSAPDDRYLAYIFHSNLNKELNDSERGQYSQQIPSVVNGQWVYQENEPKLKLGDTLYYRTSVLKDGGKDVARNHQQGSWTVTGFVNNDGMPVDEHGNPVK